MIDWLGTDANAVGAVETFATGAYEPGHSGRVLRPAHWAAKR